MPAAPPSVFTPPTPAPTAPGAVRSDYTAPTPGVAGVVRDNYAAPTPGAAGVVRGNYAVPTPGAAGVVYAAPSGGVAGLNLTVSGSLAPDATGALLAVGVPAPVVYAGGSQWSSDATAAAPGAGAWNHIYQAYLLAPTATTLEALAPKAGYVATGDVSTASKVLRYSSPAFGGNTMYWLYSNSGSPKWVKSGDGAMADRGGEAITEGSLLIPLYGTNEVVHFVGGLGATWELTASYLWILQHYLDSTTTGTWLGSGTRPELASWSPAAFGSQTGPPTVISNASLAAPGAIRSDYAAPVPGAAGVVRGNYAAPSVTAPPVIRA